MATLKIPEKANSVIHYDPEADVLYVAFGKPKPAEGIDIGDGTILRVEPISNEVVGFTILDFSKRAEKVVIKRDDSEGPYKQSC